MIRLKTILFAAATLGTLSFSVPAAAASAPASTASSAPTSEIVSELITRTQSACARNVRGEECGAYQRTLLAAVAALNGDDGKHDRGRDVTRLQMDALFSAVDTSAASPLKSAIARR
ncbi:MAG: hypothetical protein CMN74_05820 [Sphingorhabdus sp.]|nr:hypothetical protein [Sphingorhabdus sp.]|tara:strand:+ start:1204 stop:1554 length:351 start_codon:yes stop_codon:yes gene_type:complete